MQEKLENIFLQLLTFSMLAKMCLNLLSKHTKCTNIFSCWMTFNKYLFEYLFINFLSCFHYFFYFISFWKFKWSVFSGGGLHLFKRLRLLFFKCSRGYVYFEVWKGILHKLFTTYSPLLFFAIFFSVFFPAILFIFNLLISDTFAYSNRNNIGFGPRTHWIQFTSPRLWQYRLWSFQGRDKKSERFLAINQLHSNEITKFGELE